MDHIARQLTSEPAKTKFIARVEDAIAAFVKDRGFDWEFHIDETPFDLWRVQGIRPPRAGTEDEKRWIPKIDPRQEHMIEGDGPAAGGLHECH